ncbi:MAG: hypothetical protein RL141_1148 [Candidatus Parcubacteria bacterium]|jgi:hypothetical protein
MVHFTTYRFPKLGESDYCMQEQARLGHCDLCNSGYLKMVFPRFAEEELPTEIKLLCVRCLFAQEMRIEDLEDHERWYALAEPWEAGFDRALFGVH